MRINIMLSLAAAVCFAVPASASVVLSEDFNDITTLSGSGWMQINNSTTGGTTNWFQGVPTSSFDAQAGATNSDIQANFNNAGFGGNISNWLILPELTLQNGDTINFWTRTEPAAFPGDNLEIRLSTNGASTNVGATTSSLGDFTTLLSAIGSPYPEDWTEFTATISGLSGPTASRLAFRYVVTNTSSAGDIIGLDSVTVNSNPTAPEPATPLLLGAGLIALAAQRLRGKRIIAANNTSGSHAC